jgi:hypothetical protein
MRALLICACLTLSVTLSACGPGEVLSGGSIPVESPAPLANTTIDDTSLELAWKGFDAAVDAITLARTAGAIKAGSPFANQLADGMEKVLAAFQATEHAAAGLSTKSYPQALAELKAALADFKITLKGGK